MSKRIVITGYGIVQLIIPRNKLESEFHLCGRINGNEIVHKRLRKKIDNFCINGLIAVDEAIKMSGLKIDSLDSHDIGICVGNCLGGWKYIEKEVIELHKTGIRAISPYLATAWFPASLQGQISLKYGIKGFSKTYSMIDIAGMQAIGYAAKAIENGKCKVMIAGASEDLSSDFVKDILKQSYKIAMSKSLMGNNNTEFFSDGSIFFILEDYEETMRRGAKVQCELKDYLDMSVHALKKIRKFYLRNLDDFGKTICFKDGLYEKEDSFLKQILPENKQSFVTTKNKYGNQFSVSGLMDIICAIKEMGNSKTVKQ